STYCTFYFKRFRRILPLSIMVVLLCVIANASLQTGYEFSNGMKSALYSMFFVKNLQTSDIDEDYFQALENSDDFFTHFWSLCVEIQFYLLAPLLLHLFKPNTDRAFICFTYMTVITAVSFTFSLLSDPQETFDSILARLWQFLFGAMIWYRLLEGTLRFYTTFCPALLLAIRSNSVLLCHESLQVIGDSSYSLYLIHWPVVCVLDIFDIEAWHCNRHILFCIISIYFLIHLKFVFRYPTLSINSTIVLVSGLYIATLLVICVGTHI
ncbi:hypothetical protein PMAYCL1PPCAC_04907, partial [Pristionchus mayeri]